MKANEVVHFNYTRSTNAGGSKGEITERYVIPTFVPTISNIRALDVTDLSEDQRAALLALWNQYQEYYQTAVSLIFDFETWIEHSTNEQVEVKWRTFKPDNIDLLD